MQEPLVSVIVPVYRVEEYLESCVQSLLVQTYSNYEILLIDDGSPDNCGNICEEYARKNKKVKCFHKENGGLSDARNFGVKMAKGKYILFVDSDDYVSRDYISHLVYVKNKFKTDISIGASSAVYMDAPYNREIKIVEKKLTSEEALNEIFYAKLFGVSAWCKLFPKSIVEKYPFPVGRIHEDLAVVPRIIGNSKNVAYSSQIIYYYRMRKNSITHSKVDNSHINDIFLSMKETEEYISENYPSVILAMHSRCARNTCDLMNNFLGCTPHDIWAYKELKKKLYPHYKIMLKNPNVILRLKLRATAMMLGYFPTVILWKLTDFIRLLRYEIRCVLSKEAKK